VVDHEKRSANEQTVVESYESPCSWKMSNISENRYKKQTQAKRQNVIH